MVSTYIRFPALPVCGYRRNVNIETKVAARGINGGGGKTFCSLQYNFKSYRNK